MSNDRSSVLPGAVSERRDEVVRDGEAVLGRGRRVAVRILGVLALFALNFMLVFVISDAAGRVGQSEALEPPGSAEARFGAGHPSEAVHLAGGVAGLLMGVAGLAGLVARPQRAGSATHVGVVATGWILAAVVVGDPDNHGGQAGPVDPAFVVLAVPALLTAFLAAPWRSWRSGRARPEFLLAALLGLPWLWHAFQQGLMQRYTWPPMADPHHQAHWFAMSFVAVSMVLVVAGGSLPGRGWRVATTAAGATAGAIGAASLAASQAASALHPAWATGALLWGFLVLVLTRRAQRAA